MSFSVSMWSYKNGFCIWFLFTGHIPFRETILYTHEKLNLEISCIETWQVKIHHVPRSSLIIPLSYYVKLYRVPHWFHFCHKMFSLWGRSATSTPSTSTPTTPATDGFVKAGWNVPEEGSCKVAMSSDYIVDPVTVFWGDDTVDCWWKTSG